MSSTIERQWSLDLPDRPGIWWYYFLCYRRDRQPFLWTLREITVIDDETVDCVDAHRCEGTLKYGECIWYGPTQYLERPPDELPDNLEALFILHAL